MRLPRFEYKSPNTVAEAVRLLGEYKGKAKVMAGGTDLLVQMKDRAVSYEYVIALKKIEGLDYIKYDEGTGLKIGALASLDKVQRSSLVKERFLVLSEAIEQMASPAVRNLGTVGGNLCNAVPSADTAPPLIVLGAKVKVVGPKGERVVPIEGFFKGPRETVLGGDELLVEIEVPNPLAKSGSVYIKHTIRKALDLAIVGVGAMVRLDGSGKLCEDVKIALGAVSPTPKRAEKAEGLLRGKELSDALIEEAAKVSSEESRPISDVRGSEDYRKEMVRVLTARALRQAIDRAKKAGR